MEPILKEKINKVIIFSEFSEMCKILYRELNKYQPLIIIGETSSEKRKEAVKIFSSDPKRNLLIMSSAGAYGLNLQCASVIINYDQPWSIAKLQQREGRAHRFGQKNKIQIINMLSRGTVDYYVKKVLHAKAELSTTLLGDTPISMGDIQAMLKYEL